jgi:excisionase family DNA binding protein
MVTEAEELVTVLEAAKILRVHGNTIRNYDRRGILKAVRLGPQKQRRFRKADVLALVAEEGDAAQKR